MTGRTVEVTESGLRLAGRDAELFLLSGEVHYWRLDPACWGDVLDAVASLGFRAVSTYASWARHERHDGSFDWTGALDLERFLAMVAERDMVAVVRIGPNTAAEQQDAGWPRRVLDDPACQARRPGGHPYLLATATHHAHMPSYASRATLAAVDGWYAEVVSRLAPLQWPEGPIAAVQIDNEISYHFQAHSFALDHHPDAIEQWHRFLADRYGDLERISAAYDDEISSFDAVDAPTDGADEPAIRRTDWIAFREHHLRASLATLAAMARRHGFDRVPFLHNDFPRMTTPLDPGALEADGAIDVDGADIYTTKEGGRYVTELARLLAGSTRLPYLAELGTGWLTLPWLLPMATTALDEQHAALRAFLGGARAANVYMLVERDRWFGSPIAADGTLRDDKADFYRRLHRLVEELDWGNLRRSASVLLVENRDESRRSAALDTLGEVVPPFFQMLPLDHRLFRLQDPDGDEVERWHQAAGDAMRRAGIDFDRAPSSSLGNLDRYSHVVLPVASVIDPSVWASLVAAGVSVIVGPHLPAAVGPAGATTVEDPNQLPALLAQPAFRRDVEDVDLVHFHSVDGQREVLAVANGCGDTVALELGFQGHVRLVGRWYDEALEGVDSMTCKVEPWGIQVWKVER